MGRFDALGVVVTGWLVAALVLFAPARAHAGLRTRDDAFETRIRAELAAKDPGALPAWDDAERAAEREDLDAAARGYEAVRARVPTFFHATRRLCGTEAKRGHRDVALPLCREALNAKNTPENHATLAMVLAATKNASTGDLGSAQYHARQATMVKPDDASFQAIVCQIAIAQHDLHALDTCSAAMIRIEEREPMGHFFASMAAGTKGDFERADAELERARVLGLPSELHDGMKQSLDGARPKASTYLRWGGITLGSWFAMFGALFVLGSILSASALRASRRLPTSSTGHAHGVDGVLRKAYRVVLWASCGFYYVSLPLLCVFLVVAGLALAYATIMVGHIPIKLLLIVAVVIASSLYAIAKSLFVKVKDEDPGERIDLREHPRLRAALDEVAGRIGTRPVDEVYLTPFTDIAVLERGGLARQLRGSTERALVLGAGVLDGMKLRAFKGILAHEYGHFHNEDTAGGGFALAVRRSVLHMAIGLAQSGAASNANPAWWFVRGFHAVFLRISQGASRLQEVLADRWAAFTYGSTSFEEGMRHVVRRSLAFDAHADHTLNEVVEGKLALANLYRYVPAKGAATEDLEKAFDEAWNAEPSPYDSHPRPADRIAWVLALATVGSAPASPDDDDDAWSLFTDRGQVEEHMTRIVRERIGTSMGVHIPSKENASAAPG